MKILFLDLETSPNVAYVWGLWGQNIAPDRLIESSRVMCFSAKWADQTEVIFDGENIHKHKDVIKHLWSLLDEADIVIHYNGEKFDIPTANKEFIKLGLRPPSTYLQVDLLRVVRKKFRFTSNKLDYVAQELGLGSKHPHEGFSLWVKCMDGDKNAWETMEEYNKQDVVLLESLYDVLKPWITSHPCVTKKPGHCPTCSSDRVQRRGYHYSKLGTYQRYRCKKCGTWSQERRMEPTEKGALKVAT